MPFIGDQAKDFLTALNMAENGQIPLLGIESSMPQFRQGPVYIWLLALVFFLLGPSPENTAYLAGTIGVLAVGALYIFGRNYFGRKAALIAAALLAVSPLTVAHSQLSFIINPIPLISVGYLISLLKYLNYPKETLLVPSMWFGLLFQFELANAPLLALLAIVYFLKRKRQTGIDLMAAVKGLGVGLLPQIVYDLTHKFEHLGLFAAWIGYRIASFLGYKNEHAFSVEQLTQTLGTISLYVQKTISWDRSLFLIWLAVLIGGCILWTRLPKKHASPSILIWSWLAILLTSYLVHGSPSEAYFPSIAVPLFLGLGWTISQLKGDKALVLSSLLVGITMAVNSNFLVESRVLGIHVETSSGIPSDAWSPRYSAQMAIVDFIIAETKGPINLRSLGPGSEFPAFLDNFRYLLKVHGVSIAPDGQQVWLVFGEERKTPPFINARSYKLDDVTISFPL